MAPTLVSTNFYLCSLTFYLRPDEVASVLRQQKLVIEIVIYSFVSAPRRYHIMNNVNKLKKKVKPPFVNSLATVWHITGNPIASFSISALVPLVLSKFLVEHVTGPFRLFIPTVLNMLTDIPH